MSMARSKAVPGERALFWVGSAKDDLLVFPEAVKDAIGAALSVAQFGGKHPKAKPWKGTGPGVFEIVADYSSDTYRAVYTVKFEHAGLCTARVPEKIAQGQGDGAIGRGIDLAQAQSRGRRSRGSIWRTAKALKM
jgi:phage-related protein